MIALKFCTSHNKKQKHFLKKKKWLNLGKFSPTIHTWSDSSINAKEQENFHIEKKKMKVR